MKPAAPSAKGPKLEEVKQLFKAWRKTKTARERIPKSLWQAAVDLVRKEEHSLFKIAKALHLNHTDFKKQVHKKLPVPIPSEPATTFIELDPSVSVSECVIEMEDVSGAKMRMCFRGKTDFDLLELGKSFWSKQA